VGGGDTVQVLAVPVEARCWQLLFRWWHLMTTVCWDVIRPLVVVVPREVGWSVRYQRRPAAVMHSGAQGGSGHVEEQMSHWDQGQGVAPTIHSVTLHEIMSMSPGSVCLCGGGNLLHQFGDSDDVIMMKKSCCNLHFLLCFVAMI